MEAGRGCDGGGMCCAAGDRLVSVLAERDPEGPRGMRAGFRLVIIRRGRDGCWRQQTGLDSMGFKVLRRRRPLPLPASGVLACF